jgi:predicted Zn-ribbon and HTH transcriptional regulator
MKKKKQYWLFKRRTACSCGYIFNMDNPGDFMIASSKYFNCPKCQYRWSEEEFWEENYFKWNREIQVEENFD